MVYVWRLREDATPVRLVPQEVQTEQRLDPMQHLCS